MDHPLSTVHRGSNDMEESCISCHWWHWPSQPLHQVTILQVPLESHWKSIHNAVFLSRTYSLPTSCPEFSPMFVMKTFKLLPWTMITGSWFLWNKLVFHVLLYYLCWVKVLKGTGGHETLTNPVYSGRKRTRGNHTSLSVWEYQWCYKELYK